MVKKKFTAKGLTKKEKKKLEKQAKKIIESRAIEGLKKAGFTDKKAIRIIRGL